MKRLGTGVLLLAAALLLAIAAAACGGDNAKSESSASQASIDQLATRVQLDEMLNAVIVISGLPEHEMDTTLQGSAKIDNKYVPTARMLVRMTALTNWTPDLAQDAAKLHDSSLALLQALDAGKDVDAIKPLSQKTHEDWHMFTDAAWDVVTKSLPADAGGPRATATPGGPMSATPGMTMTAGDSMSETPTAGGSMTMTPGGSGMP